MGYSSVLTNAFGDYKQHHVLSITYWESNLRYSDERSLRAISFSYKTFVVVVAGGDVYSAKINSFTLFDFNKKSIFIYKLIRNIHVHDQTKYCLYK